MKNSAKKELKKKNKFERTITKDWFKYTFGDNKRTTKIYGHCRVYSPSGNLMFLCIEKKAKWYLKKKDDVTGEPIAKEIRHINPIINYFMELFDIKPKALRVQLLFEPKDEGNKGDKYSLARKENKCVITGSKRLSDLTKHHITPYCYRTYMPDEYKSANSHDIIPIIADKHYEYERKADELKEEIAKKYNAPLEGTTNVDHDMFYAIKAAKALQDNSHRIPDKRLKELKNSIKKYNGAKRVTQQMIDRLADIPYTEAKKVKSHGEIVVEKLVLQGDDAIQEFVEMWRKHFLEHAKPKYMPKYWDIKRPASRKAVKK